MTTGLEIRAQIDTENVKGLLVINGGAAVALLAFLPSALDKPGYEPLARAVLWGLLAFQVGLLSAMFHNRLRRICSLKYEQHGYNPPPGRLLGVKLREPTSCFASTMCMWLSVAAFGFGGLTVLLGGFGFLEQRATQGQKPTTVSTSPATPAVSSSPKTEIAPSKRGTGDAQESASRPTK